MASTENIDDGEIARFSAMADIWWDRNGEFKALHDINPVRLGYVRDRTPLAGKAVLDVGCGPGMQTVALAQATGGTITATVISGGGFGVLEAETSESNTIGIVWTPGFANLSVSLDYFDIQVDDQVEVGFRFEVLEVEAAAGEEVARRFHEGGVAALQGQAHQEFPVGAAGEEIAGGAPEAAQGRGVLEGRRGCTAPGP